MADSHLENWQVLRGFGSAKESMDSQQATSRGNATKPEEEQTAWDKAVPFIAALVIVVVVVLIVIIIIVVRLEHARAARRKREAEFAEVANKMASPNQVFDLSAPQGYKSTPTNIQTTEQQSQQSPIVKDKTISETFKHKERKIASKYAPRNQKSLTDKTHDQILSFQKSLKSKSLSKSYKSHHSNSNESIAEPP